MTQVAQLVFEMSANVARLQQDMARATKTVDTAASRMKSAAEGAMNALKAIGTGLTGAAFVNFVRNTAQANKELSQFAFLANMTVAEFQKVAIASNRFGVSQEKLADILKDTQDKVGDFIQTGGGAMADFFERVAPKVGVTAEQFRKLNGKDALQLYVSSLEKANLSQADMVFFMEAIASDSTLLLPLLKDNGKALDELATQAERFGLALDEGAIKSSQELSNNISSLEDFMQGISQTMYRDLLPGLVAVSGALVDWAETSRIAEIAGNAIKIVFQTISVVGSDVIFVITQISRGVVALAQATGKVLTGDFSGAANIFTAYNEQAKVARASLDDMQAKIMGIGQTSTATAEVVKKSTATLSAAFTKPTEAAKAAAKALEDQRKAAAKAAEDQRKAAEELAKIEAKLFDDLNKHREASLKPYEDSLKAQQDRIDSLKDEEKALAISQKMNISLAKAVELVNIAKLKEQQIDAGDNDAAIEVIQKEIDARKELIELIGGKEARDAQAEQIKLSGDAAKQAADDWKKAAEKIQDSITDSLMRGFEGGKGFVKNLVDTIKNMFNTMVLRPIVQAVVGSGLSAIGLGGAGGAQAGTSALSGASSLLGLGGTMATFGSHLATGFMNTVAGSGFAGTMGAASGMAGAGSFAGGAGMAAGALIGPAAVALLAANALGLFRSKKIVGGGLSGTLGEGDIESYDLQRRGGTLFSGPSYSIVNRQVSEQSEALQTAFKAMRDATAGMATQLGLANDSIVNFTTQLGKDLIHPDTGGYGIKLDGLNPEQAAAKVQEALQAANEEMAQQLLGTFQKTAGEAGKWVFTDFGDGVIQEYIDAVEPVTTWIAGPFVRDNETAAQALQRLSSSLTVANDVFDMMNVSLYETSLQGADTASALVDLFGGIEGFTASTAAYYQAFYTEAERSEKVTERLTKALSDQNLELPDSIQSYRALVDAQDRNTEAGRKTYASLIQLAPAFAQVTSAAEQQRKDLQRQLFELTATKDQLEADARSKIDKTNLAIYDQIKAAERQREANEAGARAWEEYLRASEQAAEESARAAEQVRSAWKQIGDNVIAEINRIRGVTGSNSTTNQALAQAQFASTTARARAGSQEALAALPQLSQTLEAASKLTAASALDTARMRAWLAGSLSETLSILGLQTPAFAAGGYHSGGMRLVGENGPELEVTGPSRIYNASQTADLVGGGLAGEMRALREEVSMLRAEARATAINTGRQADLMKRVTRNGEAMTVMTDGEPLEVTS